VKLSQDDIDSVARRANFFFDVNFNYKFQDSSVYTGDGVDDLDRLITIIAAGTQSYARFLCDVGLQYSIYKPFDLEDLVAIRTAYISIYGTVNKPNVYTPEPPVSVALAAGTVYVDHP
jgi:hypothetical protein